jgi:hypothetical protein
MSAPQDHSSNNNECHQGNENSNDDVYHREIDRKRFVTVMTYTTDAPSNDAETNCSTSSKEGIDAESFQSLQDDTTRRIAPTSFALAVLSSGEADHGDSGKTAGQQFDRSSASNSGGDMFPPLNRAYMLQRDFLRSSSASNSLDGVDIAPSLFTYDGIQYSDDTQHKGQMPVPLNNDAAASSMMNAAIRRYIDDVRPQAPSSVKSFGSNVGSDDCGGSLDVETHSVGARSIHSQEDNLPVTMPDPDPATVAVASLSIDQVDNGELRSSVGSIYRSVNSRQHHGRYMHLPLQRFHNNQVQFENFVDGVEEDLGHAAANDAHSSRRDYRTPANWNDPRIDESSKPLRKANANRPRPRSRSRSRSPPL